jgi:hypothetical protein
MRPFIEANQALGLRSSKIMLSGENKSVSGWLLKQFMRIMPGTRDRVAYQSLHRADQKGGQRNFPERLFVVLEIKRSAGRMIGFCYDSTVACDLVTASEVTIHLSRPKPDQGGTIHG